MPTNQDRQPDSRVFASYPMPAKIDLIMESRRRESADEQRLYRPMGSPSQAASSSQMEIPRIEISGHQSPTLGHQVQVQAEQQQAPPQPPPRMQAHTPLHANILNQIANKSAMIAAELAEKEAKLMADIVALHERPYSPFSTPAKIDLSNESVKLQRQTNEAPSPRPMSRHSSQRPASADLYDKERKLMREVDEIERKPFNPQTMVVEREQWFEYPAGQPGERQLTDSRRRVKDFCTTASDLYPQAGGHIHEERPASRVASSASGSLHTAIIRTPRQEIDNKSPLPFAFDNFTTKGVRGNIASAGAIEPDRPRAPIYPIMKRSPSPNVARG